MIELILSVRRAAVKSVLEQSRVVQHTGCSTVNDRFQSHLCKIFDSASHHTFKTKLVAHIHRTFLGQILIAYLKANAITFRIGISHGIDRFLRQRCHEFCHSQLIITDIFTICVEITHILQIRMHNHIRSKIIFRHYHLTNSLLRSNIRIITGKPVNHLTDTLTRRKLGILLPLIYECRIDFYEQLHTNCQFIHTSFIDKTNHTAHLGIQECQHSTEFLIQDLHCIRRIGKAVLIMFRQNICIQRLIAFLKFLKGCFC